MLKTYAIDRATLPPAVVRCSPSTESLTAAASPNRATPTHCLIGFIILAGERGHEKRKVNGQWSIANG
ncbi:MAG: hypothetical protein V9G20_18445 [Candidatus Promineifilaceae bacterium]